MTEIMNNYNLLKNKAIGVIDNAQKGKVIIQIGNATCENAAGANEIRTIFSEMVKASGRDDILIKETGCTGRCAQEPIVGIYVEGKFDAKYKKVNKDNAPIIFQQHVIQHKPVSQYMLDKTTDKLYDYVVTFCSSGACKTGEEFWSKSFDEIAEKKGVPKNSIRTFIGGCLGVCDKENISTHGVMMVYPQKVIYQLNTKEDLEAVIESHFIKKTILKEKLIDLDTINGKEFFMFYGDISFFNKQTRIALRNCGILNPSSIDEYLALGEFDGFINGFQKKSQWVIDEILLSGLRGRGGAGYPTGVKWQSAAKQNSEIKYVICNADEGDPGAFMDRSILEGSPYDIINGMMIAAYAIGASKGFAYIRAEYPLAIERMQNAIDKAKEYGLLGKNILGTTFSFDIEIRLGAGAFVCGEETALMASIKGERGQPVIRPPYPTESGLWQKPTIINNVETFANVGAILKTGASWFNKIGTENSKGTKVFALAGKVNNTGLIEVPMGTTLKEILYSIGGGIVDGKQLKAIQTGGPSGGCIPASLMNTEVDYESLIAIGSMMGSGGMIVLDEEDCMVATARFFLEFTQDESCGKCTPCREGTLRMLEILERITSGKGVPEDLDKIKRLGKVIKKTSLCGLGQAAPNPVLSMLAHFEDEFLTHINEKRCPTMRCKKLIQYSVITDKCIGCTLCARLCPVFCISGSPKKPHLIDQEKCSKCGECFAACKYGAIFKS